MANNQKYFAGSRKQFVLSENWAEPYTLDELAVDSRKVSEISTWLSSHRHKGGILLVTGPTGCGKTAVVKCVSRSLSFEIREWITPLDRDYQTGIETGVFQNQTEKFEDFLYSSSRYSNLFVKTSNVASLLLVEDYPNIFLLKPEIFHGILGQYCKIALAPIIFICSDSSDKSVDIAYELFPQNIQRQFDITHVSFNPVTRTKMMQALKRMGAYLQSLSPGYKLPTQDSLNEICESANGDVRYAMLSLQMKPQEDVVAMFDFAGKRGPSNKKKSNFTKQTQEDEAVSTCGKDDRVGLLHAVGRVLYPKWKAEGEKINSSNVKRKRKEDEKHLDATMPGVEWIHNPNTLADSYSSSAGSFLLLVQENYLKTYSSIESVAAAAFSLSLGDVAMNSEGVQISHEISFNAAIRGVMVHNKSPHRAWNQVKSSRCHAILNTQKKLSTIMETLFPLYPVSPTVLMTEVLPYMYLTSADNLSNGEIVHLFSILLYFKGPVKTDKQKSVTFSEQLKFVKAVASMESLTNFCENYKTLREPYNAQKSERATFVLDLKKQKIEEKDDELHISEDESDNEVDEGAANLTMLEAAMAEDVDLDEGAQNLSMLEAVIEEEVDYNALLNDSDDDDILLSQL
ncbi:Cell cycle checkpoint protein RAD17 [Frankliniella fusca]|uniref:Cell cycle checkpoint protein RAD17 n=1 Tax=Frankliniella fusca TaxID=407009 RepID=A0AAE1HE47_9NEOP|nr:Cell cycle checkpoint protein RAD17 [Frankliniella fusca]